MSNPVAEKFTPRGGGNDENHAERDEYHDIRGNASSCANIDPRFDGGIQRTSPRNPRMTRIAHRAGLRI